MKQDNFRQKLRGFIASILALEQITKKSFVVVVGFFGLFLTSETRNFILERNIKVNERIAEEQ